MKPAVQHRPAVNIARRGPPSSTQRPNAAAEVPRKKIARVKTQPSSVSFQSPGRIGNADRLGHRQVNTLKA